MSEMEMEWIQLLMEALSKAHNSHALDLVLSTKDNQWVADVRSHGRFRIGCYLNTCNAVQSVINYIESLPDQPDDTEGEV